MTDQQHQRCDEDHLLNFCSHIFKPCRSYVRLWQSHFSAVSDRVQQI